MTTHNDIIRRSRDSPAVFGGLYDRHASGIYRYAARRAGDFAADDVTSETFLVAWEQLETYDLARDDAVVRGRPPKKPAVCPGIRGLCRSSFTSGRRVPGSLLKQRHSLLKEYPGSPAGTVSTWTSVKTSVVDAAPWMLERLRVSVRPRSLGQMNDEGQPMPASNGRAKRNGIPAFLPIGIVFVSVGIAMIFTGTTAWIAFFTVGITFLILGMQKPTGKDQRPPSETSRG